MAFQIIAPIAAPINGATQNSQSWPNAGPSAKSATPVDRAGFTDVLVTGIEIRWISVNPRPIAIGANPAGAPDDVEPRMMIMKKAVRTISITNADINEYPCGEASP